MENSLPATSRKRKETPKAHECKKSTKEGNRGNHQNKTVTVTPGNGEGQTEIDNSQDTCSRDGSSTKDNDDLKRKYKRLKRYFQKEESRKKKQLENDKTIEFNTDIDKVCPGDRVQIEVMVKTVVFKRQKFISDEQMKDLSNNNTIPNRIMNLMNHKIDDRVRYWAQNAVVVKKQMEKLRTQKTTAMRNEFYKTGTV